MKRPVITSANQSSFSVNQKPTTPKTVSFASTSPNRKKEPNVNYNSPGKAVHHEGSPGVSFALNTTGVGGSNTQGDLFLNADKFKMSHKKMTQLL